ETFFTSMMRSAYRAAARGPLCVHRRRSASLPGTASRVDVRSEHGDVAQIAVALGVVQAVADDELDRDVEADVLAVDLDLRRLGLAQQRAHLDGLGSAGFEVL